MTSGVAYSLERSVLIEAPPETVFAFFTDSARWASWWGEGSTIDARVGGRMYIRHPGGVEVGGEVTDVRPPEQIAFTYTYLAKPDSPSNVVISLTPNGRGATRLRLQHAFTDEAVRDEHVQGWRYQLSLFGNLVAGEVFADAASTVDAWFGAWSDPDTASREQRLARIVSGEIRFRDRFSLIDGLDDLRPHLAAVHRFMPGIRLERQGDVRHCQGVVLAEWVARGPDGAARGAGTNVFVLGGDGRIQSVTGVWK